MRKIITALLTLQLMSVAAFGAVSEDMNVYVRKDVFEVYMQNINANQERILQRLDKLDDGIHTLNQTVANLSGRVDGLDKRIDDLRNGIYLWLVAIGLIVAWPKAREMFRKWGTSAPSITLEDVRRLIEENNAEIRKSFQV